MANKRNLNNQIVTAVKIGRGDAGRVVGQSLKDMREMLGLTQAEMAGRLRLGQAAISKIESRGDVQISSLVKYVEAIGARLNITAVFPSGELFDTDIHDDNQLCFSIFGDDLFRRHRDVVLSIRPEYSQKIIGGVKTVELRRRFPLSAPRGTLAFIYSTSPERAMVGRAKIVDVVKMPVKTIWREFSKQAFIERGDFETYFSGVEEGFALKFANAQPLPRKLGLAELRKRFGFEPPQSFLYAKPTLRTALQDEYAKVPH